MPDRQDSPQPASRVPQKEVHRITNLEQMKILSDPLRIRILESFTRERTTKQVAELIGEKPTKLYHHVETLERVGLIELTRTRQNRGTLEKYYLSVARSFQADSSLFCGADDSESEEAQALRAVISTIFDNTAGELRALVEAGGTKEAIEDEGLLSYLEIRATEKELREIQQQLRGVVESLARHDEGQADGGEAERRYRLTLAYFPLDLPAKK